MAKSKRLKLIDALSKIPGSFTVKGQPIIVNYQSWNRREQKAFRDALVPQPDPYSGYSISQRMLPKNHPARNHKYNFHDITSAFLDLLDESERIDGKSKLTVSYAFAHA